MKMLHTLTHKESLALWELTMEEAFRDKGKHISVAIVDVTGEPIDAHRMPEASADSFWIALNKARTALRAGKDTVEIAYVYVPRGPGSERQRRPAHEHRFDDNRRTINPTYVSWAGGVVIHVEGQVAGALAVSGRDELDDHDLADRVRNRWYAGESASPQSDAFDFAKGPPNA